MVISLVGVSSAVGSAFLRALVRFLGFSSADNPNSVVVDHYVDLSGLLHQQQ